MAMPEFVFHRDQRPMRLLADYLKDQGRIASELDGPVARANEVVCPIFFVHDTEPPRVLSFSRGKEPHGIKVPDWAEPALHKYVVVGTINPSEERTIIHNLAMSVLFHEADLMGALEV